MPERPYRLDGLLRLRRHQEDNAQVELADAQRRTLEVQAELDEVLEGHRSAVDQLQEGPATQNVAALQAGYAHLQILQGREAQSRSQLGRALEEQEVKREGMVAAHRATRTIEQLRERALERYRQELDQEEQRESDEVGAGIAARKVLQQQDPGGRDQT
ncbi:flagellar export protein FliJ [bacterium]|nr:flagellar export protein FliJ [bacterium]